MNLFFIYYFILCIMYIMMPVYRPGRDKLKAIIICPEVLLRIFATLYKNCLGRSLEMAVFTLEDEQIVWMDKPSQADINV